MNKTIVMVVSLVFTVLIGWMIVGNMDRIMGESTGIRIINEGFTKQGDQIIIYWQTTVPSEGSVNIPGKEFVDYEVGDAHRVSINSTIYGNAFTAELRSCSFDAKCVTKEVTIL
ncbi:hypothetical protein H6504_02005 [Candidatus Woesearchaeota archaeon]|nr:hypothetical protein [Candidatus Woesearchaeota archaeon]